MLKHNFLYNLGMARLVVTFPDRFFFVDGEKHLKCIEIGIVDLKYTKTKNMTSIFEGSEPPEGAPPTSGLLLESHLNLTCKRNS